MKPSKLICNLNEFFLILSVSELKDFFLKKAKKERGSLSYSTRGRTRAINSWAFFTLLWGGNAVLEVSFRMRKRTSGEIVNKREQILQIIQANTRTWAFTHFPPLCLWEMNGFVILTGMTLRNLEVRWDAIPSQKNQLSFLKLSSLGSFLLTSSSYCFFNSYNGLASRSGHIPASCLVLPGQAEVVHVHKGRQ